MAANDVTGKLCILFLLSRKIFFCTDSTDYVKTWNNDGSSARLLARGEYATWQLNAWILKLGANDAGLVRQGFCTWGNRATPDRSKEE